ncbi:MAG: MerR family transcriptional regulator [Burkholderiales bacterium]|jgi:DNA-binding transcriptional MerR regulator/methylmalonyl-CoA mutase cobalamin-binding subunit|nr:MerR family transcriptional regulator [Burkholderiales bacterium]
MSPPLGASLPGFTISAVERETGLSKDLLRMWERRYGFPRPARDAGGERLYSSGEVARLRAVKRLMDLGMRPGGIVHRSLPELDALADARSADAPGDPAPETVREVLALLHSHDAAGLRTFMVQHAMRQGLQQFVLATVAPLNRAVGAAWMGGDLQVFEEHLYTETVHVALRSAINAFPRSAEGSPRVLLTTFPGESHHLGLLMVEALLVPEGAQCISLGTQTPVEDVRRAALAYRANVLALSFSGAYPLRAAVDGLESLRAQLPPPVTIWAGGELARRVRRTPPGIVLIPDLAATLPALRSWKLPGGARSDG